VADYEEGGKIIRTQIVKIEGGWNWLRYCPAADGGIREIEPLGLSTSRLTRARGRKKRERHL
jgi:hypothetical protein